MSIGEREQRKRGREIPAPKLHIPPVEQFEDVVFNTGFESFLFLLRSSPNEYHSYRINNRDCNLVFNFSPKSAGWTLNKVRYTQATILNKNPLWNALNDKRKQLEKVNLSGHRGIIVCDGDCETLKTGSDWDQYGVDEIIREQFDNRLFHFGAR